MNVQFRNRTYAPGDYTLVTVNGIPFARIDISTRPDCKMVYHVRIEKPEPVRYQPTWERTPYALVVWTPVVTLSPAMLANVNFAAGDQIQVAA